MTLEHLGRINLLVGSNNAGKTSVLEAIAVLNHPFDPLEWFNILRARETRSVGYFPEQLTALEALRWMFPASDGDVWGDQPPLPIYIKSTNGHLFDEIHISCEPIHGFIEIDQFKRALGSVRAPQRIDGPIEDNGLHLKAYGIFEHGLLIPANYSQEWTLWSQLGLRSEPRRQRPRENVQYLAPYAHRNSPANMRLLSEATKFGGRDDIDALLRDLDPRILGVEIITSDDGRSPKLAFRMRNGGLMPQGVFGDGVRRALSIALALRTSANGLLLIDEIEAALHVNALDRVYRWLEGAAESFDVQIFATTHSLEAIDAIIKSVDPASQSELSGYALGLDGDGDVKRYTGGMLHRLVRQRGLDIRG